MKPRTTNGIASTSDVLNLPGFVAAQRFCLAETQMGDENPPIPGTLWIETNDRAGALKQLQARVGTNDMVMTRWTWKEHSFLRRWPQEWRPRTFCVRAAPHSDWSPCPTQCLPAVLQLPSLATLHRRKCCNFEIGDGGRPERNWAPRSQAARSNSLSINRFCWPTSAALTHRACALRIMCIAS